MTKTLKRLTQFVIRPRNVAVGSILLATGVMFFGTLVVFLATSSINTAQDVRRQASTNTSQVAVTVQPSAGSTLAVNQTAEINLLVNTQDLETTGVQMVFDITHSHEFGLMNMEAEVEGNLEITANVYPISQGFQVRVMALAPTSTPYQNNQPTQFIKLKFKPTENGQIKLVFNNTLSHSALLGSNPPDDRLVSLSDMTYLVGTGTQPSNTPTPTVTSIPTKNCNEVCSSNLECGNNQYCYNTGSDYRCRLADNPSHTSCQPLADQGLSRTCNQYCADSNECANGLTCWYNKCRQLDNIENTNCLPLNSTQLIAQSHLCNQACSTNADCAVNLRCFNGACRLAVNPTSSSCSLPPIQVPAKTQQIVNNKGSNTTSSPAANTTPNPATDPKFNPQLSVTPTIQAQPSVAQDIPSPTPVPPAQPNALSELINSLRQSGRLLPVGVLVLGLILLLTSFLASILSPKPKAKVVAPTPPPNSPITPPITQPPSSMADRLKEKGVQPPQ